MQYLDISLPLAANPDLAHPLWGVAATLATRLGGQKQHGSGVIDVKSLPPELQEAIPSDLRDMVVGGQAFTDVPTDKELPVSAGGVEKWTAALKENPWQLGVWGQITFNTKFQVPGLFGGEGLGAASFGGCGWGAVKGEIKQ